MTKILITGATGQIAGATLHHLAASGADIRALIRDESKAEALRETGAEVVVGDLRKPHTLGAAFEGVDKVLLIMPVSLDAVELAHNAIAAAMKSGNPHVVYLSANVPEPVNETEVGRQRTAIEAELIHSGLPYTIIRPTFFMQNTMMAAQTVAADGMMYLPFGEGQLGMMDIRDVGAATAQVLISDGDSVLSFVGKMKRYVGRHKSVSKGRGLFVVRRCRFLLPSGKGKGNDGDYRAENRELNTSGR